MPTLLLRLSLLIAAALFSHSAQAQSTLLSESETRQYLLIWAGGYVGLVDGVWGPKSDEALSRWYVGRYGIVPSYLSARQRKDLIQDAATAANEAGFVIERDLALDVTFAVPSAILKPWSLGEAASRSFRSPDGRATMTVEYLGHRYASLDQLFRIKSRDRARIIEYEYFAGDWFVLSGTESGQHFYERYAGAGVELRGFSVRYAPEESQRLSPAVVAMSNLFRPSANLNDPLVAFASRLPEKLIDFAALSRDCVGAADVGARIRACNKIISLNDDRAISLPVALYHRAAASAGQGRWDVAVADYSRAIQLRPSYAEAHFGRAEARRELGPSHYDLALVDYRAAVRLLPPPHRWREEAERWIAELEEPPGPTGPSAILYEEPMIGLETDAVTATEATVEWSFSASGPNGPEIKAHLRIPSRSITVEMALRQNRDDALPASHLIQVRVDAPFVPSEKSIASIPRIVLKPTESARGEPLVGAAAKVADGLFWIALSSTQDDVATNLALLRGQSWIDLPFVYENGQRAILTFEKGEEGTEAFERAAALWDGQGPAQAPGSAPAPHDQFQTAVVQKAIELKATADAAARRSSDLLKRLGNLEAERGAIEEALNTAIAEADAKNKLAEVLQRKSVDAEAKLATTAGALEDARRRAIDAERDQHALEGAIVEAETALIVARSNRDNAAADVESATAAAAEAAAAASDAKIIAATVREAAAALTRAGNADPTDPKTRSLISAAARSERDAVDRQAISLSATSILEKARATLADADAVLTEAAKSVSAARAALDGASTSTVAARKAADELSQTLRASEMELTAARDAAGYAAADAETADATVRELIARREALAASIDQARTEAEEAATEAQIAAASAVTAEALANLVVPNLNMPPMNGPKVRVPPVGPFTGGGIVVSVSTRTTGERDTTWITVKGPIQAGDDAYFNRALLTIETSAVIVSLESPGGDVETGIKIGRTIWNNQYRTVVEGGECYSMCAYIWLAGRPRFMSPGAKIGFHAPWKGEADKVEVSSVGSAVVGGYLADLGFTAEAMAYMTAPGPDDMQILTAQDAQRLGVYFQDWR